nr:hypothetical protein [Pandoravirus massiliensis]
MLLGATAACASLALIGGMRRGHPTFFLCPFFSTGAKESIDLQKGGGPLASAQPHTPQEKERRAWGKKKQHRAPGAFRDPKGLTQKWCRACRRNKGTKQKRQEAKLLHRAHRKMATTTLPQQKEIKNEDRGRPGWDAFVGWVHWTKKDDRRMGKQETRNMDALDVATTVSETRGGCADSNACTVWYTIEAQTDRLPNALWATAETDDRHRFHASAGSHAQLVERLKERAALCGCTSPALVRDAP